MGSLGSVEIRYLDVIWLDNLFMNFLLLWTVFRLSKNRTSRWRLCLSACIGAVYAVLLILPGYGVLAAPAIKLLLSICMLLAAYRFVNIFGFLKLLAFFYLMTFVFGGAAFGLYFFFSESIGYDRGIFYIRNYPAKLLFFSAVLVMVLYQAIWPIIRERISQKRLLYQLSIEFDGQSKCIDALLDTGNGLVCPMSHSPVLIVEFDAVRTLLPEDICGIFSNTPTIDFEQVTRIMAASSWIDRFRMLPFQSLGETSGMMIGYKPDRVQILLDEGWKELEDIIVGIYNQRLTGDNEYHALVHPLMLQ